MIAHKAFIAVSKLYFPYANTAKVSVICEAFYFPANLFNKHILLKAGLRMS
jgi:hypothetical protein